MGWFSSTSVSISRVALSPGSPAHNDENIEASNLQFDQKPLVEFGAGRFTGASCVRALVMSSCSRQPGCADGSIPGGKRNRRRAGESRGRSTPCSDRPQECQTAGIRLEAMYEAEFGRENAIGVFARSGNSRGNHFSAPLLVRSRPFMVCSYSRRNRDRGRDEEAAGDRSREGALQDVLNYFSRARGRDV